MFGLSKQYKIWFSPDPNSFLGVEDQLRFVRMRQNNLKTSLHFIYSSACLSSAAQAELQRFCRAYRIIPIAFERLRDELVDPRDKAMYACAEEEIQRTLNHTGGNMASASDCTRLLVPLIEKYGIYTDFDLENKLAQLSHQYLSLPCPVLFSSEMMPVSRTEMILQPNSDFLAFSLRDDLSGLSAGALQAIRALQETILENYQRPFVWEKLSPTVKTTEMARYPEIQGIMEDFNQRYPDDASIFDFRTHLAALPDLAASAGQPISVKKFFLQLAVVNISGPGTYNALYKHLLPKGVITAPLIIPATDPKWQPYLALYERSGLTFYERISQLVDNKNSYSGIVAQMQQTGKNKQLCDKSWTTEGMLAKKAREQQIHNTALTIQGFWRHRALWRQHAGEKSLDERISKVSKDELLLTPLRERKYALVLRRACAGLKLPVVKLVLHYQQLLAININEASMSNPNTALDWAEKARAENPAIQLAIIALLRAAGAQTAEELKKSSGAEEQDAPSRTLC